MDVLEQSSITPRSDTMYFSHLGPESSVGLGPGGLWPLNRYHNLPPVIETPNETAVSGTSNKPHASTYPERSNNDEPVPMMYGHHGAVRQVSPWLKHDRAE